MKRFAVVCVALCIALVFLLATPCAFAQEGQKPTKESLLLAWENAQKESPYTVTFKKTAEAGVYDYETTIFPFKGKLKVLNLLIDKHPAPFYDYPFDEPKNDTDYMGIVEVKPLNLSKDFRMEFFYSYPTWERGNEFHYDAATSQWYTLEAWHALKKTAQSAPQSSGQESPRRSLFALFYLFLIVGVCLWAKKDIKKRKATLERFLQNSEENLVIQREILGALKRKQ